ncbi:dihydrolipoyl dehydrogenase [Desulfobacter hydrogenophilus]|uniref:Dihydrolipoyl dehydrogenase n=1 Tax=Desulfobacter hydrogenophilus TaxID=2291 RepID=A0A328FEU8_9BACT|nr:dihydrolipoyl dehydrogenase [Desulfobacter hydrogenophilus]NDY73557.1 dihydrolipoyl dehydrogenase [Desulfobacter hydrogenophilus]QBH14354.1 dihydrolipoyl dehydrogenase [Desulfobacter hydrogenophilus]RAM02320.1 dihydrolipoyl dehydrogenase [Desulfobacter hydrogenophilus]
MAENIIIIGAGPGGYVAALRAAGLGARVTLIEKEHLGGTCLNYGCIPSKIMKNSADLLLNCLKAGSLGINISGTVSPDISVLMQRKEKVLESQRKGLAGLLEKAGVTVVIGRAKIVSPGKIEIVSDRKDPISLAYDKLIIAAGTVPMNVSAFPFDHEKILSSNDILSLDYIPKSLTIVGGGVIGCEFAFIFSSFGCQVTIVEAMDRILPLPSVDVSCSKLLLREMKKRKIKVLTDTIVTHAESNNDGLDIFLDVSPFTKPAGKLKTESIESDVMAVCIGRSSLAEELGLENIGLKTDKGGWITVNEYMQTRVDNIYAIGDILGPAHVMLAHVAYHEGFVAAANACGQTGAPKAVMSYDTVPGAIFTMPEIGTVGLTEKQAREQGKDIETAVVNFRSLGKAHAIDQIAGEAKMIVEKASGKVIGVHMTGPHATDLIAEATLAINKGLTATDLAQTIHAHPTLAEVMGEAALKILGTPLHG